VSPHIPGWANAVFVFIGLAVVCAAGMTLSFVVGGIDSNIPAELIGPLLCPDGTLARALYERSLGSGAAPILLCSDVAGQQIALFRESFFLLWDAVFVVPLLPLVWPIVLGLRRHQFGARK
jgi:hypothetical protein